MINAEKYRDKLLKFIEERDAGSFSFSEGEEGDFWQCGGRRCSECGMSKERSNCSLERLKWLLSEYKEPIKLSKVEYELLRHLYKTGYSYIVRDGSNSVYVYEKRPCRINLYWAPGDVNHNDDISLYKLSYLFQFLKWSDEEPTSIKEVLENCEVVGDDL